VQQIVALPRREDIVEQVHAANGLVRGLRRRWGLLAAVLVVAGAAAGGAVVLGGIQDGGGGGLTANLFVVGGGGACTRSSTPVDFAGSASPDARCGALDTAQDAASGGDTVRIENGTYGTQTITGAKASTVTYIGESKAGVVFTGSITAEDRVTLQDLTIANDGHQFTPVGLTGTTGVRLSNVDMLGDYIAQFIYGVEDFEYVGGDFGDFDGTIDLRHCDGSATPDSQPMWISDGSADILIEGLHFSSAAPSENDQNGCPSDDDFHLEIVRVDGAAADVTLRRNVFDDNQTNTATLFISDFEGKPTNVRIVGNVIGEGRSTTINWGGSSCGGYVFAYNTVNYYGDWTACSSFAGTRVVGNLGSKPGFAPPDSGDVTWLSNVSQSGANTSYVGTWVSGSDFSASGLGLAADGHLNAGSPAIDTGETDVCTDKAIMGTRGDIDGDPRPAGGSRCDAGADEFSPRG
jgi:hypothetical protein